MSEKAGKLDTPISTRRRRLPRSRRRPDSFGRLAEGIARFIGTPRFLLYLTVFCAVWLLWNGVGPESLRFDSAAFGFTLLTLMLSIQASYSAPLILLAQDRQADRDRVGMEQDRVRAERNLADTEYLAREVASLRLALNEVATRDFVRSELRGLLEDIVEDRERDREPQRDRDPRRPDTRRPDTRRPDPRRPDLEDRVTPPPNGDGPLSK